MQTISIQIPLKKLHKVLPKHKLEKAIEDATFMRGIKKQEEFIHKASMAVIYGIGLVGLCLCFVMVIFR